MKREEILAAVKSVPEIGYIGPDASPPDILGVFLDFFERPMHEILAHLEMSPADLSKLLSLSECYSAKETPRERRDRLVKHFSTPPLKIRSMKRKELVG